MGRLRLKAWRALIGVARLGRSAGLFAVRKARSWVSVAAGMRLASGMFGPKLKRPPKKVSLLVETSDAWIEPPNFSVWPPVTCETLSMMS
jgi:hypothetical protein